ncbi:MAG: hypothetical protein HY246_27110, partial [Proteobacteria bacterium]|nr:hypothetical protein [Pseudomonadota bacterium]
MDNRSTQQIEEERSRRTTRERRRSRLLLAAGLAFTAIGAWMLADAVRRPAAAEPGQLWKALAIVLMFGLCSLLSGYQIFLSRHRLHRRQNAAAAGGPLIARHSGMWHGLVVAGCLAFAAAGVFLMLSAAGSIAGLLAAIVFGGFAVIAARRGW